MAAATIIGKRVSSGKKATIQKIEVQFWEYGGLTTACGKQDTIPDNVFEFLKNSSQGQLPVKGNDAPILVKDKWIYIFKRISDQKFSLSYELKTQITNNQQKYNIVSWTKSNAQKWATTYPRTCLTQTYDAFALDNDIDYYVLLSRIQLTTKRLTELLNHGDTKIVNRALRLPSGIGTSAQGLFPLYLLDYLSAADSLRNASLRGITNFESFVSDADRTNLRYVTEMIHSLEQVKPEIKDWLDFSASERERTNQNNMFDTLMTNKENSLGRQCALLSSFGYRETLDDYTGTRDLEDSIFAKYASHVQLMDTDPKGLEYLRKTVGDDQSWLHRYFTEEEPFEFYRKISTLAGSPEFSEFLSKFVLGKALTLIPPRVNITLDVLVTLQEKIIVEYGNILTRANIVIPELVQRNGKYFWVAKDELTRTVSIKYELKATVQVQASKTLDYSAREAARKRWEGGIESASLQCKRILLVIELVNLYTSINKLMESKGASEFAENAVNLVGAFADGIGATKFLLEKTVIENFGEEFATKIFSKVTIVGAVCDYVGAIKGTYQATGEKNYGLAAGYSVIALSAVAAGASGALALSGAGAVAFGLSASTLGLIGVALFVVGAGLVWAFTEEDLEKWAKKCRFGKKYEQGYALNSQIYDLNVVLCKFSIDCYLFAQGKDPSWDSQGNINYKYDYFFSIKILPGLLNEKESKFKISLTIEHPRGTFESVETVFSGMLQLPDGKTEIYHAKGDVGPISMLIRRFSKGDLKLTDDFQYEEFRYRYSAQLDLKGNGSELIPSVPVKGDGKFETRTLDVTQ